MCNLSTLYVERGVKIGLEQGIEKGFEQGIEQGIEQGVKKGIKRGIEQGVEKGRQELIVKMLDSGLSKELISSSADIPMEEIERIIASKY